MAAYMGRGRCEEGRGGREKGEGGGEKMGRVNKMN